MTAMIEDLHTELVIDFVDVCEELAGARFLRAQKDTPQTRAAVAECLERIDTVLDVYLEVCAPGR
jgi:hypothetical protein